MIRHRILPAAALLALLVVPAGAQDDAVFEALDAEILRAQALKMKNLDTPYYLSGFVSDNES